MKENKVAKAASFMAERIRFLSSNRLRRKEEFSKTCKRLRPLKHDRNGKFFMNF